MTVQVSAGVLGMGGKPRGREPGGFPCMQNTTAWPRVSTFPGLPISVSFIVLASPGGSVASVCMRLRASSQVSAAGAWGCPWPCGGAGRGNSRRRSCGRACFRTSWKNVPPAVRRRVPSVVSMPPAASHWRVSVSTACVRSEPRIRSTSRRRGTLGSWRTSASFSTVSVSIVAPWLWSIPLVRHTSPSPPAVADHPAPSPSPPVCLEEIPHRAFVPRLPMAGGDAFGGELGGDLRQGEPLGLQGLHAHNCRVCIVGGRHRGALALLERYCIRYRLCDGSCDRGRHITLQCRICCRICESIRGRDRDSSHRRCNGFRSRFCSRYTSGDGGLHQTGELRHEGLSYRLCDRSRYLRGELGELRT